MSKVELDENNFVVDITALGDPEEFCQGRICNIPIGACKLRLNSPLSEYICMAKNQNDGRICGAKFEDDEDEQDSDEDSYMHKYAPDPSLFYSDENVSDRNDINDYFDKIKEKLVELNDKIDVIIEFLQENVHVLSAVTEADFATKDGAIYSPWLDPPTDAEVRDELKLIIEDSKKRSLNLTIDSIRGMINKRFGTRYKNTGVQKLIDQYGFSLSTELAKNNLDKKTEELGNERK